MAMQTGKQSGPRVGTRWYGALGVAAGCAVLMGAGCGGGDDGPSVARAPTGAGASSAGSPGAGPVLSSSQDGRGAHSQMVIGGGAGSAAFSACMRRHGEPSFPDPGSDGSIAIDSAKGIDPQSSTFIAAQEACESLMPHHAPPSEAEQAKTRAQALAFSGCMRTHGVPRFPDPVFSGTTMKLALPEGGGVDPGSPGFLAAQKACQEHLPGKVPPPPPPRSTGR